MEGYIHIGDEIDDFLVAEKTARGAANSARFFLTVHAWDEDVCKLSACGVPIGFR